MRELIRGQQRPAEAIRGKQWQAVASSGKQWQAVASKGNHWQSLAITGKQWQSGAQSKARSRVISRNQSHLECLPQPRQLGARRIAPLRLHLQLNLKLGTLLGQDGALWGEEGAVVSTCMLGGSALLGKDGALWERRAPW